MPAAPVPLAAQHVLAAAALVTAGVARLRERVPVLPSAWADERVVARLIRALAERGTGAALMGDDGTLLGFQAATILDGHGGRWAYTPDIAHATAGTLDTDRAVERLYSGLAEHWVQEACVEHVVTVLADDEATIAAYGRLGFAPHVVDLVRDLRPVEGASLPEGGDVRRAVPGDAPAVLELHAGLVRHLRAAPVFLRIPNAPAIEIQRRRIADPAGAVFIATVEDRPVAFLRIGPSADDVATIVRDKGTASITGAYTAPELRGTGIGSALLAEAVAWARAKRYVRCAVDHEAANGEASRFWSRHATPVAISLARRLPPMTVPGVA
ncbi:MAG TPA: GNAT family N-acetyltransferase [Candidatus Limnocylindrales bacterium]|jgi:GNAT superfamily N-acetyltransferase